MISVGIINISVLQINYEYLKSILYVKLSRILDN